MKSSTASPGLRNRAWSRSRGGLGHHPRFGDERCAPGGSRGPLWTEAVAQLQGGLFHEDVKHVAPERADRECGEDREWPDELPREMCRVLRPVGDAREQAIDDDGVDQIDAVPEGGDVAENL